MDNTAAQPLSDIRDDSSGFPAWARASVLMREYYTGEWGMPIYSDNGVFERLALEGFQAGLSWATVLSKRPAFREAFHGFDIDEVAAFEKSDVERLMAHEGIIRNRRKIEATISNAHAATQLRAEGGLAAFIWSFMPHETYRPHTVEDIPSRDERSVALAKALKTRGFTFVGPTTMFALMEALGMIDTHLVDSPRRGSSGLFNESGIRIADPGPFTS